MYKNFMLISLVLLFVASCAKDTPQASEDKSKIIHTEEITNLKDKQNFQDLIIKLEQKRQAFREVDKIHDRYHWSNKSDDLSADEKKKIAQNCGLMQVRKGTLPTASISPSFWNIGPSYPKVAVKI